MHGLYLLMCSLDSAAMAEYPIDDRLVTVPKFASNDLHLCSTAHRRRSGDAKAEAKTSSFRSSSMAASRRAKNIESCNNIQTKGHGSKRMGGKKCKKLVASL